MCNDGIKNKRAPRTKEEFGGILIGGFGDFSFSILEGRGRCPRMFPGLLQYSTEDGGIGCLKIGAHLDLLARWRPWDAGLQRCI